MNTCIIITRCCETRKRIKLRYQCCFHERCRNNDLLLCTVYYYTTLLLKFYWVLRTSTYIYYINTICIYNVCKKGTQSAVLRYRWQILYSILIEQTPNRTIVRVMIPSTVDIFVLPDFVYCSVYGKNNSRAVFLISYHHPLVTYYKTKNSMPA